MRALLLLGLALVVPFLVGCDGGQLEPKRASQPGCLGDGFDRVALLSAAKKLHDEVRPLPSLGFMGGFKRDKMSRFLREIGWLSGKEREFVSKSRKQLCLMTREAVVWVSSDYEATARDIWGLGLPLPDAMLMTRIHSAIAQCGSKAFEDDPVKRRTIVEHHRRFDWPGAARDEKFSTFVSTTKRESPNSLNRWLNCR